MDFNEDLDVGISVVVAVRVFEGLNSTELEVERKLERETLMVDFGDFGDLWEIKILFRFENMVLKLLSIVEWDELLRCNGGGRRNIDEDDF